MHAAAVRDALAQLAVGGAPGDAAEGGRAAPSADGPLAVVDAFAVPRVVFDPVRRAFHRRVPCRLRVRAAAQPVTRR